VLDRNGGAAAVSLTERQLVALEAVQESWKRGEWYRAKRNGERVTLASLFYRGLLTRRVWRGTGANAANEYAPSWVKS
jgi:hypothetical protein